MTERLVVVGGDAAGMSAASQAKRARDDLEVVVLEKGRWTSYSACGIPYLVGGDVGPLDVLVARSPAEHRRRGIDARTGHEATALDLDRAEVEVHDAERGETYRLAFDHLMLATGAVPRRPSLPGVDDAPLLGVQTLEDATALVDRATDDTVRRVVVVGGGYIGLELAEAFVKRDRQVTVVEAAPEVMSTLDPDMGALVSAAMRRHGIDVRCGEEVVAFERDAVVTAGGPVPADLVVLGMGVVPNTALAAAAGVPLGVRDAVVVDRRQRTEVEGVWAAGDCCQSFHLVSQRPVHLPLGTVANKQGRVAGVNLGGGYATFPGVVGTAATRLCDTEIARTGLSEREATAAGFAYETATIESTTRAAYFPGSTPLVVKVLAERESGRLLGAQIVGQEGAGKRIDVLATALTVGMTVDQLLNLDLSYAPPFAPVWDPVLVAARRAWQAVAAAD